MRFKIVAIALVAALGFGTIAAVGAKPKKVKSTVTINFDPGPQSNPNDYSESSFKGRVGSKKKKKKCRKGRTVTVKEIGSPNVGKDKTNKKGRYEVPAGHVMEPDEYSEFSTFYARVKKKRKGNTICKKAKSPIIPAP